MYTPCLTGKTLKSRPAAPSAAAGSTRVPASLFRAPSAAQRSDRGPPHHLSGQQKLFTRESGQYRVTGQVSELVTLRKAVLHLPRARMCQAREKKALLLTVRVQEVSQAEKHRRQAVSRAEPLGKWVPTVKSEFKTEGQNNHKQDTRSRSFPVPSSDQKASSPKCYSLPFRVPF